VVAAAFSVDGQTQSGVHPCCLTFPFQGNIIIDRVGERHSAFLPLFHEQGGSMVAKSIEQEDEYFARVEMEMKKKIEKAREKKITAEEKKRRKELHFMKCPKCGSNLVEIDFKGVKIDECSECRGMWLDAGEYDAMAKIGTPVLERLFSVFRK
jgi:ribosomal protein L37AE/L43A